MVRLCPQFRDGLFGVHVEHQTGPAVAPVMDQGLQRIAHGHGHTRPQDHETGMVGNAFVGLGQPGGGRDQIIPPGCGQTLGAQAPESCDVALGLLGNRHGRPEHHQGRHQTRNHPPHRVAPQG